MPWKRRRQGQPNAQTRRERNHRQHGRKEILVGGRVTLYLYSYPIVGRPVTLSLPSPPFHLFEGGCRLLIDCPVSAGGNNNPTQSPCYVEMPICIVGTQSPCYGEMPIWIAHRILGLPYLKRLILAFGLFDLINISTGGLNCGDAAGP